MTYHYLIDEFETRVQGISQTHNQMVEDLETKNHWAYQWKMLFNPDIDKQAIEVIFSAKNDKPVHPDLSFNNIPVSREENTKHLGFYLDSKLSCSKHIREAIIKATKGISLLRYLSKYVSR